MKAEVTLPDGTEINVETADHLDQIKAVFEGLQKTLKESRGAKDGG
jgi:hypothetical protein